MKKPICLALVAALLLMLCGVGALAEEGIVILEKTKDAFLNFTGMFTAGDTLYMYDADGLYTWQPGEDGPTFCAFPAETSPMVYIYPFAVDDQLYAVRILMTVEDDYLDLDRAELCDMAVEGGSVAFEPRCELAWDDMLGIGDEGVNPYRPQRIVSQNGIVLMQYTDLSDWSNIESRVTLLDIEAERLDPVPDLEYIHQLEVYKDGLFLAIAFPDGDEQHPVVQTYDPVEDVVEELCTLELNAMDNLCGLAYDAGQDVVYVTVNSEIHTLDPEAGEIGPAVGNVPFQNNTYYNFACVLSDGEYAFYNERVAVVDLSVERKDQQKLTVSDTYYNTALDSAIGKFGETNSNVVFNVTREQSVLDNLVENLVNKDGSVDIYLIDATLPLYDALTQRGYMMELDGSEKINTFIDRLYPAVRENVTAGGHIVAIPVSARSATVGFSEPLLEKLGLTLEDVPNNWGDLFDFLASLEDGLVENDLRLTFSLYTVDSIRENLFDAMFTTYREYLSRTGSDIGYDNDLLRGILDKFDALDLEALGCATSDFDEIDPAEYDALLGGENNTILMDANLNCAINGLSGNANFTPVLLSVDPETEPNLILTNCIAFVNPYTQNPELALEFMETLAERLPESLQYTLIPDLDTPVRGEANEKILAELSEQVEKYRQQWENSDGAQSKFLQDSMSSMQDQLELLEGMLWEVSQHAIDWYRPHAERLAVAGVNWIDDESRESIQSYLKGDITASEMLEDIDRKATMMRMEGN